MYGTVYELHFYSIIILKICSCKSGLAIAYQDETLEGRKNAVSM